MHAIPVKDAVLVNLKSDQEGWLCYNVIMSHFTLCLHAYHFRGSSESSDSDRDGYRWQQPKSKKFYHRYNNWKYTSSEIC